MKTKPFSMPIGSDFSISQGDARSLEFDEKFDAVITDPPYYDNVIYSEISNFFYAWLRVALKEQYSAFEPESTPRAESIVANPAEGKGTEEFESELKEAFSSIGCCTFEINSPDRAKDATFVPDGTNPA